MKNKIWLSSPHMGGTEMNYVQEAYNTNWVAPLGPNVNGFEQDILKFTNAKACAALSSGTAAIHLALILLGVEQDDEVLVSTFTFSATINPIIYQKAKPIFVDSEKDTWNMCPVLLENAIADRIAKGIKPKAIVLVHLYGMPSKMEEIISVATKYNIPVIEDAAEALGSTYKGKAMGTHGEIGIYSFNGNKIITTSGGGALVSNKTEHCAQAVFLATQARDEALHYQHSKIGFNYRMSNILAGIGRGQMEVLNDRVAARRANHAYYKDCLSSASLTFLNEPEGFFSNRWLTCVLTNSFSKREKIREALAVENIEARPLWKPMHRQPIFKNFPSYLNGVSDALFEKGLCLPSGSNLPKEDLNKVIKVIKRVVNA
tara:strand:- start:1862 stop:2980 length:1119 start_codon:yes stop_codon:yes gene_type:complete